MARIRYLAMLCADPAALAGFYARNFGLDEIGRSAAGDVTLTDGGFNVTLFKHRGRSCASRAWRSGCIISASRSTTSTRSSARYRARYPRGTVIAESGDLQHGEVRIYDPECNPVTLSQKQFRPAGARRRTFRASRIWRSMRSTPRRSSISTADVFGFRELFEAHKESRKRPGYRNKHVGDGHTNVAIQAFYSGEEGHEARFGIAHFGFLVPDSKAMAEHVQAGGATVTARPAHRTQSEIRMRDPEGNGCDLSQRGWEVDTDKWVRADAA